MQKIMFNDKYGLTSAVLSGKKTQTRRIIPNCNMPRQSPFVKSRFENEHGYEIKPKYKIGEVIAIAQNYSDVLAEFPTNYQVKCYQGSPGYANKMFVMADFMPHRIRITNIRVERLQDISDEDCLKEGVEITEPYGMKFYCVQGLANRKTGELVKYITSRDAYAALIDKISGKGTWENNPWVWVYDFELVDEYDL